MIAKYSAIEPRSSSRSRAPRRKRRRPRHINISYFALPALHARRPGYTRLREVTRGNVLAFL